MDEMADAGAGQKRRMAWTPEMHGRFVDAVNRLGGLGQAMPAAILAEMNVSWLTREQVKSHLQKYTQSLQRDSSTTSSDTDNGPAAAAATGEAPRGWVCGWGGGGVGEIVGGVPNAPVVSMRDNPCYEVPAAPYVPLPLVSELPTPTWCASHVQQGSRTVVHMRDACAGPWHPQHTVQPGPSPQPWSAYPAQHAPVQQQCQLHAPQVYPQQPQQQQPWPHAHAPPQHQYAACCAAPRAPPSQMQQHAPHMGGGAMATPAGAVFPSPCPAACMQPSPHHAPPPAGWSPQAGCGGGGGPSGFRQLLPKPDAHTGGGSCSIEIGAIRMRDTDEEHIWSELRRLKHELSTALDRQIEATTAQRARAAAVPQVGMPPARTAQAARELHGSLRALLEKCDRLRTLLGDADV